MERKKYTMILGVILLSIIGVAAFSKTLDNNNDKIDTEKISGTIINVGTNSLTIQDKENLIYTFNFNEEKLNAGDNIIIEYTGLLDKNKNFQSNEIVNYETNTVEKNEDNIPKEWLDDGIFSDFYILANSKIQEMSLDEKIGQLLLVRHPDNNATSLLNKYYFGGFVFFEKDFKDKTKQEVKDMMKELQNNSKIPLLTAVDEEGGDIVRISNNSNLVSEKFKSPMELYKAGGLNAIKEDTINKSKILNDLGINLNLAPVVDVSTNSSDYMYHRTLGEDSSVVSDYAKTVISNSKNTGVSYTLKHFPGYGNTNDTHSTSAVNDATYNQILDEYIPPFKAGVEAGAEAVLVSHNIVKNIDSNNPASLSKSVHNLLRNEVGFTGIVITDDLAMGAVSSVDDAVVKAILAGNDMLIVTDYDEAFSSIKNAISDGTISESLIDKLAFRIISWKYYKGLMYENQK